MSMLFMNMIFREAITLFGLLVVVQTFAVTGSFPLCKALARKPWDLSSVGDVTCFINGTNDTFKAFESVRVIIRCSNCEVLHGSTFEEVQNANSLFNKVSNGIVNLFMGRKTEEKNGSAVVYISPFEDQYFHVKRSGGDNSQLQMNIDHIIDGTRVALFILGLILYFGAPRLANSVKFYYTGGIGIGVLASLIILVFILSRLMPKKSAAVTMLVGGWGLCGWLMKQLWEKWPILLEEYSAFFMVYIVIAGFTGFAICYRRGPVSDVRSQNIIQWTIQFFSIFVLYISSRSQVVSIGIAASVFIGNFLFHHLRSIISNVTSFFGRLIWKSKSQPRRLLTEEEYRLQGEIETEKAMRELRNYCNSPQCSPWKTMSRIKDPVKFIQFMNGQEHVSDAEITLHENEDSDEENLNHSGHITDDCDGLISEDSIETTDDFGPRREG